MERKSISKVLAENLKRFRKREKLTIDDLAKRIGVTTTALANWEHERRWIGSDNIAQIARALDIPETDLFKDSSEPEPITRAQVIEEFGRLLANAEPKMIRQALQLLEVGQQEQAPSVSPRKSISNK